MHFDHIEKKKIPDFECDLYSIKNLVMGNATDKTQRVIEGNSFIFDFTNYQYFHTLHDKIGQYEFLKQYVPDLKLIPVAFGSFSLEHLAINGGALIMNDLMRLYNLSIDDFYFLSEGEIKFKNVKYIYNFYNYLIKDIDTPTRVQSVDQTGYDKKYHMEVCRLLRNKFSIYLTNNQKEKIYVSRKNKSKELNKIKSLQEKKNSFGLDEIESKDYEHWFAGHNPDEDGADIVLNIRTIEIDTEDAIEDFFFNLGYKIVHPDLMTLSQQANLFYNATHIASINGTGCYNNIFANYNSRIFIINSDSRYKWLYEDAAAIASNTVYNFPILKDDSKGRKFSKLEIIEQLNKHRELM